jgi:hypothetical protein
MRTVTSLPSLPDGADIRDLDGWSVVVPEATTNLITNPSFEASTAGYADASGGTFFYQVTNPFVGYAAMLIELDLDGDGVYWTIDLNDATTYTATAWIQCSQENAELQIAFTDTANVVLAQARARVIFGWQRLRVTWTATATATYRISVTRVRGIGAISATTDAWQCEAKAYPTTYCDGDQRGYLVGETAYTWTGTPHASTSTRNATTASGGRAYALRDFNFTLTGMLGTGQPEPSLRLTPYASVDGSVYEGRVVSQRALTLTGRIASASLADFQRKRSALRSACVGSSDQPTLFLYQPRAATRTPFGLPLIYAGGLEGSTTNYVGEDVTIRLVATTPDLATIGGAAISLDVGTTVANVGTAIQTESGWETADFSPAAGVTALAPHPSDASVWAAAVLTSGTDWRVHTYDATINTWTNVTATAANNTITDVVIDTSGNVIAVGTFTTINGVAATRAARYNGSAWSALGTGPTGPQTVIAANGTYYCGHTGGVAVWDGAAWNALGTFPIGTNTVYGIVFVSTTELYTVSRQATVNVTAHRWDGSAWTLIGTMTSSGAPRVNAIVRASDGSLIVGGSFDTISGISARNVARWNGSGWAPLGTGYGDASVVVSALATAPNGVVYASGGTAGQPRVQQFVSGTWSRLNQVDAGVTTQTVVARGLDGALMIGYDAPTTTFRGPGVTPVSYDATQPTAPIFFLLTSTAQQVITNATTGISIVIAGTTSVPAGTGFTLDLTPGAIRCETATGVNLLGLITTPTALSTFRLVPGSNTILVLTDQASAFVRWNRAYQSLDDLA